MNPVAKLNDHDLLTRTHNLAKKERNLLVEVLHCLREIERRRLFSSSGCTSLFDFCVRQLGYSEDQAQRRILAMRLIRKIPEVQPMIEAGSLTLTGIGLAHAHIQREEKASQRTFTPPEALSVLRIVEGKPSRIAERALLAISGVEKPHRSEQAKPLSDGRFELRITITQSTWEKAQRLVRALAHKSPNLSLGELFGITCDLAVDTWITYPHAAPRVAPRKSPLHRAVWARDQGRCRRCGSQHALQVDHIHPKALGGADNIENLRLLCRNCNQRAAIETYGIDKMESYL